jgi:hypothetical protein
MAHFRLESGCDLHRVQRLCTTDHSQQGISSILRRRQLDERPFLVCKEQYLQETGVRIANLSLFVTGQTLTLKMYSSLRNFLC